MNSRMMQMLFKQILLVFVMSVFTANSATAASQELCEQATLDELSLAREIASIKEKLAEYKISKSFLSSAGDVFVTTAMGAGIGVLAGLLKTVLTSSAHKDYKPMMHDVSFYRWVNNVDIDAVGCRRSLFFNAACACQIGAFAIDAGFEGFLLGIVNNKGNMPLASKKNMAIIIAVHVLIKSLICAIIDNSVMAALRELKKTHKDILSPIFSQHENSDIAMFIAMPAILTTLELILQSPGTVLEAAKVMQQRVDLEREAEQLVLKLKALQEKRLAEAEEATA